MLEQNKDNIFWQQIARNTNPSAIELIKENLDKVGWYWLSSNPEAIDLLEENKEKINWDQLSNNPCERAMKLIEENLQEANWNYLSSNPSAMYLLEQNKDKINWYWISGNPNIFEYDYDSLNQRLKRNNQCFINKNISYRI